MPDASQDVSAAPPPVWSRHLSAAPRCAGMPPAPAGHPPALQQRLLRGDQERDKLLVLQKVDARCLWEVDDFVRFGVGFGDFLRDQANVLRAPALFVQRVVPPREAYGAQLLHGGVRVRDGSHFLLVTGVGQAGRRHDVAITGKSCRWCRGSLPGWTSCSASL